MQKPEQIMLLPSAALAFALLLVVQTLALPGLQDFNEELTEPSGFIAGKDHQYILTGTSFRRKGCVHQVKVLAEVHGGVFALDVWRPDNHSSFTLASSVEFTPKVETRTIFLLDASPPVQFQAGDLIGFHLVDNIADFQVGWTPAPSEGLTMSSTQGGGTLVTTFPGGSWMVLDSTWPILFLSTSDTGICSGATFSTGSRASTKPLDVLSTITVSSSSPSEIVSTSSATSPSNIDASSTTMDASPDFPGNSPLPPEGIAGILVAAIVVIILAASSVSLIAVCRLKTRKDSWRCLAAKHPAMNAMLISSTAISTSPLIQGEETGGAVRVVIQPNPAYVTTRNSSDATAPSVDPPTPADHSSLVVMQLNPAYSTVLNSARTAAHSTAFAPTSAPAVLNSLSGYPSLLTYSNGTKLQAKQQAQVEGDHTYCSVSTCTTDVNVYEYIH